MRGIDYAWGVVKAATLKARGYTFVARYVSTPGNSKNLKAGEVAAFLKAGIAIVVVFETTADRALRGAPAGRTDAISALDQLAAVALRGPMPIYFAVDFDASPEQQRWIGGYFRGVASTLGVERTGAYGGYWVIKRLFDTKMISYGWQTRAWSGGHWEPRAQLRQFPDGQPMVVTPDGVQSDTDEAVAADFGQWPRPTKPQPKPHKGRSLPGPTPKPPWFWKALKKYLDNRKKGL